MTSSFSLIYYFCCSLILNSPFFQYQSSDVVGFICLFLADGMGLPRTVQDLLHKTGVWKGNLRLLGK